MAPASLSLVAFLSLIGWRFLFAGLWRGRLVREIDVPQHRHNALLGRRFRILDRADAEAVAGNLENGSHDVGPVSRNNRAQSYLRRILALTGATSMGSGYVLDVGTTRFEVRDRYVRRVRDVTDPKCTYEETCFYPAQKEMPKAEQIATVLLQLTNNPSLFDKWAVQGGLAFKADGQVFRRAQ